MSIRKRLKALPLTGVIERRLLVNYRVDPEIASRMLPPPFRPQLVGDAAVAGICLIRLGQLRPLGLPAIVGLRSENAAHRFAVEWDTDDGVKTGVYIPRRDTSALANVAVGGRLFPGEHHLARFTVHESPNAVAVSFTARDGSAQVTADVTICDTLDGSALFPDLAFASSFFQQGGDGYSATRDPCQLEGLHLDTTRWSIEAATTNSVRSSFFEDRSLFPSGTAELDCALVMRQVPVTWTPLEPMVDGEPVPATPH